MKDRNVQYPNRYRDKITGNVVELEPLPGDVTETGSVYNKANVLPDSLCIALGIPTNSEPKDAFLTLAGGRWYGKYAAMVGGSQRVGGKEQRPHGNITRPASFASEPADDFGVISPESGGDYTKIFAPPSATRVKITTTVSVAQVGMSQANARLYQGDTMIRTIGENPSSDGVFVETTLETVVDLDGTGRDYFWIELRGRNNEDDVRNNIGIAYAKVFKLEVLR